MIRESSLEAHESIKPEKENHYEIIKKAMEFLNTPAISKHISYSCIGLNYHQVARRLSEMEQKGMVKVVGRMPNVKNRPLLWELNN